MKTEQPKDISRDPADPDEAVPAEREGGIYEQLPDEDRPTTTFPSPGDSAPKNVERPRH